MDGYLPTFGPSYLTFYGSESAETKERKNSNLGVSEKSLNEYHGRILVEINTLTGQTEADAKVVAVGSADVTRVQPQVRTVKHTLFCSFFAANMIAREFKSENVNFEISIGAYGNGLYGMTAPCASKTTAYMPMYDSSTYYCMPWGSMKPCCVIPCSWERYDYRIRASNYLEELGRRLAEESGVISRKIGARDDGGAEIASDIFHLLESTLEAIGDEENLRMPAPGGEDLTQTELDRQLAEVRRKRVLEVQKGLREMRDRRIGVEEAVEQIHAHGKKLRFLARDPQIGIPDLNIWMLVNGNRMAHARLPAKDFFYIPGREEERGKDCGKLIAVHLKWATQKQQKSHGDEIPALIHVKIFLAVDTYRALWENFLDTAKLKYFAETFENQSKTVVGKWIATSKRPPKFSDEEGRHFLPPEVFNSPPGWKFESKEFKVSRL